MKKMKYNPARVYKNTHLTFENSRNVSTERLKTIEQKVKFRATKNSFNGEASDMKEHYNINDRKASIRGRIKLNKTSRKGARRGTTEGIKMYPIVNSNKFNTNRITARRNLENANASMLSKKNPDVLSENRRRIANETAAPNVVIYQQFSNCQTFFGNKKTKRGSRGRVNPNFGLKEIMRNRNKHSPKSKLFSSIGSGPIGSKNNLNFI